MEQDELAVLSHQAQEMYNAYQRRFESDDWKSTVEWATEQVSKAAASIINASKWDDVVFARGSMTAYQSFVNLEADIENQFKSLAEEAKGQEMLEAEEQFQ